MRGWRAWAGTIDVFKTARKVFAEGARVNETPLPRPVSEFATNPHTVKMHLPNNRRDRRRMFRRLNHCAIPGYSPLCMDSNDPDTVLCAYEQRLLRDVPEATLDLNDFAAFVQRYLDQNLPRVRPLDFEEWLATTSYNEARKDELRAVHESLRGGRPTRRQASKVSSFVKSEFYPTWKHARMINSRADAFKAWSGPLFKAIEEAVYGLPEFIKHVPVPDRPALISALRKAGMRYYATDFTAFESHFIPKFMDVCEVLLYRHCLGNTPDADFLCSVITGPNSMHTRTGVHCRVRGRRMSGDMCTSLGNGFTNLMLAKYVAHLSGGTVAGFVEGDDGIFASTVPLDAKTYAALGFTIKIEEVADPTQASFCGMVFAGSGEIVRDPRRFFQGFGWTNSFINAGPKIMDELLRAKALSTVYETPQCPVVGALARHALAVTAAVHPRFVNDGYHVAPDVRNVPVFSPAQDTRELFAQQYGVSIPVQLLAEQAAMCGDMARIAELIPPTAEQLAYTLNYVVPT